MILKPILDLLNIKDIYIRKNFLDLNEYFRTENQLFGFKFFEINFSQAVTNFTWTHGLGFIPQDLIVTQITGSGRIQFNNGLFTDTLLNITTTGPCRVRFFVGTYWNFVSNEQYSESDFMQFSSRVDL